MAATVTINLRIFLLVLVGVVGLLILVSRLYRHPSRPCPNCSETVRITSRTCPHCQHQFAWFRFGR